MQPLPFLILILILIPSISTAAADRQFTFSNGLPEGLELQGAVVESGTVLADFSKAEGEWHEFLTTQPAVHFEKGRMYQVAFSYKIEDAGGSQTRFYSLLRSKSGGDIYGDYWMWNRYTGASGTVQRLFEPDKDDYYLIIGVRHNGAIRIRDLTIREVSDQPPGADVRVKSVPSQVLKLREELAQERTAAGSPELLKQMLIVLCDEGSHDKAASRRDEIVRTLMPDFVDWSPFGPVAKDYGIRASQGGVEYQEYYKFEGPEVWDGRYKTFDGNGFAESPDGTLIQDETWGEGGYYTCHNGYNWHNFFIDKLLEKAKTRSAICQDNIGCAPFYKGGGCFCPICEAKFRNYLAERYYGEELAKMGIDDLGSSSVKDRVYRYGLVGTKALDDPIVREYIKFQFRSQLLAWADCVKKIRELGKQQNRYIPVYGNQCAGYGPWPFSVIVGEFNDVIQIEEGIGASDSSPIPRGTMNYKVGLAAGHSRVPVWVRGPVINNDKTEAPYLNPLFWQVHLAEALANGGVRDISLGVNAPWTGKPETLDYIDSPDMWDVWKTYSSFVNDNRALLTNRKSLAKVALVWSLPTMMFRRFYPLRIDDNSYFEKFEETAGWLEEQHIPFDVIIFGHSEFFPTDVQALKRYNALVIPACDAVSDIQTDLLKAFVRRGGKLLVHGKIGIYDDNLNRRSVSATHDIETIDLDNKPKALAVLQAVSPVTTDAPASVSVNVWMSMDGRSLDLHLVNYGADLQKRTWNHLDPIKVTVKVPADYSFRSVTMEEMGARPKPLKFSVKQGRVEFTVPPFGAYAIVSLGDRKDVEIRNNVLLEERSKDRKVVKAEAARLGLY